MNHNIFLRVTAPAVLIGLLLLAACLASARYINHLQSSLTSVLEKNVTSLKAAQELEIRVRSLRYRSFLYLADPDSAGLKPIDRAEHRFEEALETVQGSARSEDEIETVKEIELGYKKYRAEMAELRNRATELTRNNSIAYVTIVGEHQPLAAIPYSSYFLTLPSRVSSRKEWINLDKLHPINQVVDPSEKLVELNQDKMSQTLDESKRVSDQGRWAMLLLGLCGPLGGIAMGYGVARGLSRSIYRLSVRMQDVAQRLDRDVASVSVAADGDIQNLDNQLQYIIRRVEEATENFRQQQRELIRAEQLATVGQLAAGVAHEIRNPLTGVKLLVEAALRPRNNKPLTKDDLQVVHREIGRLEKTVEGLLDLARPTPPQRSACDLRDVVRQACELVQARAERQGVELRLYLGESPLPAAVDQPQFHKVLVNLFLNALDGMNQGGMLEVSLELSPGREIRLCVADTGPGISGEILSRLFTPFTTTKPAGTGLGLSISRRIIEEHGGRISASNRPERGACFVVTLPQDVSADS
jgi:signal transduction histidine kinase